MAPLLGSTLASVLESRKRARSASNASTASDVSSTSVATSVRRPPAKRAHTSPVPQRPSSFAAVPHERTRAVEVPQLRSALKHKTSSQSLRKKRPVLSVRIQESPSSIRIVPPRPPPTPPLASRILKSFSDSFARQPAIGVRQPIRRR